MKRHAAIHKQDRCAALPTSIEHDDGVQQKIPKEIEPAKIYRNIFEDMRSAFDLDF